jgi:hypothetical protein
VLQNTSYFVNLRWASHTPLSLTRNDKFGSSKTTAHQYTLSSASNSLHRSSVISFTASFAPNKSVPSDPLSIQKRNSMAWNDYWNEGGFVDLTASSNPNAIELQRRIILSQYHVRVNSAATGQSPQEEGLMNNGWYGECLVCYWPLDDVLIEIQASSTWR